MSDNNWLGIVFVIVIVGAVGGLIYTEIWTLVQLVRYFMGISTISTGWIVFAFVWQISTLLGGGITLKVSTS